jgi:tryptophan synthase alpha chain
MKNRINTLFEGKDRNILSVYFTAGFPSLSDTRPILKHLQDAGADMVEIGMPFSDPVADGPVIQRSNEQALANGMTLDVLFSQLEGLRDEIHIPVVLMGYINPVLRYGMDRFLKQCSEKEIDGIILPDLPVAEYRQHYSGMFEEAGIHKVFLITPQTSVERINMIDSISHGFIYMVSSSSTTGKQNESNDVTESYFSRISEMQLNNRRIIGFGIHDHATFSNACNYASGAIIGSAFIRMLSDSQNLEQDIHAFVASVKK